MNFLVIRLKLDQENATFMYNRFKQRGMLLPGVVAPNVKQLKKTSQRTDKVFYVPAHKKEQKPKGKK